MREAKRYTKKFLIIYLIFVVGYFLLLPVGLIMADEATPSVTVGNATPVASGVSLNGDVAITLTENTTKAVTVTGTVTDNNSCLDLTSVIVAVYKQGATCATIGVDEDADDCYLWEETAPDEGTCTGIDDMTYIVNHEFAIEYYADGGTWLATVTPADEGAGTSSDSTTVTLNGLQSLNVGADISFGEVAVNANSTGDHTATVRDTGNVAIDFKLSGGALTCDSRGTIPVGNQEYALASFLYTEGTDLSAELVDVNAVLGIPESDTVPIEDITYWQVGVPTGVEGTCTGTTTFTVRAAL
jgi:hypothetical protein